MNLITRNIRIGPVDYLVSPKLARAGGAQYTMLDVRLRKNLDFSLLIITLMIVGLGLATLYSATHATNPHYFKKQAILFGAGLIALAIGASFDYARASRLTSWIYSVNIVLLTLVFKLGGNIKGSQRWIPLGITNFQPSEFAKIAMVLCLATFLYRRQ